VEDASDDSVRTQVPLKRSRRDPDEMRAALAAWLGPRVSPGSRLELSPFELPEGTGVANETVMFDARWSAAGREREEGFVVRIASDDPLYTEADIEVHHDTYAALADVEDVPVPRVYGYEPDAGLIGAPFFVMERMHGQVPGDSPHWNTEGFVIDASPEERGTMWRNAVKVLAALHQVGTDRFSFLTPRTAVSGFEDHLTYWKRSLDDSSAGTPHETLEAGYEWLVANMPHQAPTGISWGDSRFANIMFKGAEVVSIFDWDTVSLAGAEADLAWWRYMDGPSSELVPGIGSPDELVTLWQELTGRQAQNLEYFDLFTTFRLGVIMMRLFTQMGANGVMPQEMASQQARHSAPTLALAGLLAELA
jgi:aminoglycoside phosphotransferase (APT) family kinase protein